MFRLLFAAVIALGGMVALAAPASADPLCEGAVVDGSLTTGVTVGPVCVPYPFAAECGSTQTGLGTLIYVRADTCVPAP
jgi:hypothetical protein